MFLEIFPWSASIIQWHDRFRRATPASVSGAGQTFLARTMGVMTSRPRNIFKRRNNGDPCRRPRGKQQISPIAVSQISRL